MSDRMHSDRSNNANGARPVAPLAWTNNDPRSFELRRHTHDRPTSFGASPEEADPTTRAYEPGQPKSLSGIALRAFALGSVLTLSTVSTLALLVVASSPLWRLPCFFVTLSVFHFSEFWTTAEYNNRAATVDSFLLTSNWPAYAIAHACACAECLLVNLVFGGRAWLPRSLGALAVATGLALVVFGQTVRSAAMIQCGPSFNHNVQKSRAPSHTLVTAGVYATFRHPSYVGFFWWAVGTQLVLGNVVCLVGYTVVLWKFFADRIRHEETLLVRFFGDEYIEYRKRVGTKLPFI